MDKKTFIAIKDYQEDSVGAIVAAKQLKIDLEIVELVYSASTFEGYIKNYGSSVKKEELEVELMDPARAGYYRGLVVKKTEENSNLKEQRGWLLEQVYYLRKTISFLEVRKKELEKGIDDMQKTIMSGIPAVEQLEDNKGFNQLSEKTSKLNR